MTRPGSTLASLSDTPSWYRCMRHAYLCGVDSASGKSVEHRLSWIVGKIKELSALFAIDVAACEVMSNHHDGGAKGSKCVA